MINRDPTGPAVTMDAVSVNYTSAVSSVTFTPTCALVSKESTDDDFDSS